MSASAGRRESEKLEVPNPGSDAAVDQGCLCPVLDNGRGRGRGDGLFWISESCPLHGQGIEERS